MPMPKIYDSSFAYQLLSFFFSISPVYLLFQVLLNLLIFFLNNITFIVEIFEFSQFIDIVLSLYSNVPIHIFILYFHLSAPGFSVPDFQQTQLHFNPHSTTRFHFCCESSISVSSSNTILHIFSLPSQFSQ